MSTGSVCRCWGKCCRLWLPCTKQALPTATSNPLTSCSVYNSMTGCSSIFLPRALLVWLCSLHSMCASVSVIFAGQKVSIRLQRIESPILIHFAHVALRGCSLLVRMTCTVPCRCGGDTAKQRDIFSIQCTGGSGKHWQQQPPMRTLFCCSGHVGTGRDRIRASHK
jgi:hypothetical protein